MFLPSNDELGRIKSTRFCPVCNFLSSRAFQLSSLFWFWLPTVLVLP
jgi:hypothetical protein